MKSKTTIQTVLGAVLFAITTYMLLAAPVLFADSEPATVRHAALP